jgi:hypothetical protein
LSGSNFLLNFRSIHIMATDGIEVVDKIEAVGSQSGATAAPVMIKASGEIAE